MRLHLQDHWSREVDVDNYRKPVLDAVAAGLFDPEPDRVTRWRGYPGHRFRTLLVHRLRDGAYPEREGAVVIVSARALTAAARRPVGQSKAWAGLSGREARTGFPRRGDTPRGPGRTSGRAGMVQTPDRSTVGRRTAINASGEIGRAGTFRAPGGRTVPRVAASCGHIAPPSH